MQTTQHKNLQCHNGPQWQALFNSEINVHFPLKLKISWLDEQMSAFQEPSSPGKLSTAFFEL
jgi:glycine cleavage system regulatory protein